jgi:hypothetical protein
VREEGTKALPRRFTYGGTCVGCALVLTVTFAFVLLADTIHGACKDSPNSDGCLYTLRGKRGLTADSMNTTEAPPATATAKGCRNTSVGDNQCYKQVMWAMRTGIVENPTWYEPLTSKSSFEDFQRYLHNDGNHKTVCPDPLVCSHAPSLFCWSLVTPNGAAETQLLSFQKKNKYGIFGCQATAVYSSSVFEVAPGFMTTKVNSDLKVVRGGEWHTNMDVFVFWKVWDRIIDDAIYANHDWTVKVDPDSVFFPGRLQDFLVRKGEIEQPGGVYINNCKYGVHGSLEVLSANAVTTFAKGRFQCVHPSILECNGGTPCGLAEDAFLDKCLGKVLGIRRDNLTEVGIDRNCVDHQWIDDGTADGQWVRLVDCKIWSTSYHAFKDVQTWTRCMSEAQER